MIYPVKLLGFEGGDAAPALVAIVDLAPDLLIGGLSIAQVFLPVSALEAVLSHHT
jgi:hypothetical protein